MHLSINSIVQWMWYFQINTKWKDKFRKQTYRALHHPYFTNMTLLFYKMLTVNGSHIAIFIIQKKVSTFIWHFLEFRASCGLCESDKKRIWGLDLFHRKMSFGWRMKNHEGVCQLLALHCSSFWSCFSSFEMFTRCIIRNWPFKWKTGMSNLYLSNQSEFSGSVMFTSCKINWNRDRLRSIF